MKVQIIGAGYFAAEPALREPYICKTLIPNAFSMESPAFYMDDLSHAITLLEDTTGPKSVEPWRKGFPRCKNANTSGTRFQNLAPLALRFNNNA